MVDKYYKDKDENCTVYVFVTSTDSLSITVWDDGNVDCNVIEMETIKMSENDYMGFNECSAEEALSAYAKFENRCKEIVNSNKT